MIDQKYAVISLALAALVAFTMDSFADVPFLIVFVIVVLAMLVYGFIADYEDDVEVDPDQQISEQEIEREQARRKKRMRPYKAAIWIISIGLLSWLAWVYGMVW